MSIVLTWLWQGIVIAAVAAVALRCVPRASADTRHAAWWVALVAVLGIPLALVAVRAVPTGSSAPVVSSGTAFPGAIVLPAAPPWAGVACAAAWMLIAAAGVMRLARRWRASSALAHRSSPFDACREARLPLWSRARATARRRAELRISDDLGGACALGLRQPMIVVGRRLSAALDDDALDLIVLHEHAHIARRDDVLQVLQACILAVAGWHPAVWWLSRRIDLEREVACDDYVLVRSAAARQYASALMHAAGAHDRGSPVVALPAATRPSALRVRVGRLFDAGLRRGRPRPLAALILTMPLAAVAGAPQIASLVVFVDRAELDVAAAAAAPRTAMRAPESSRGRASAPEQQGPGRVDRTRSEERVAAPLRSIGAGRRAPGSTVANLPPLTVMRPPATAEEVLPSTRRHSPALGMAAQAADPQPSPLLDMVAPPTPAGGASWASLAGSSSGAATVTATAVADGAKKGGLSLGRAFTRAGKAFAGTFQ